MATSEVIGAGGAFNSFQLLKLSFFGPREDLESLQIPEIRIVGRTDYPAAYVDYELSVRDEEIRGLRVVDASVFLYTPNSPFSVQLITMLAQM